MLTKAYHFPLLLACRYDLSKIKYITKAYHSSPLAGRGKPPVAARGRGFNIRISLR